MFKWFKPSTLDPLSVSMAGVKLGDRVLVIGCSDPKLIAALAAKSGLTGRMCAVDESVDRSREAERVALSDGALIEAATAPYDVLPYESEAFDLVVLRNVWQSRDAPGRLGVLQQAQRVLRPGGRCMVIDRVGAGGIAGILRGDHKSGSAEAEEASAALKRQGFVAVRALAEREGTIFLEAIKKNAGAADLPG
jgi:SAM-dependent methyltransferase